MSIYQSYVEFTVQQKTLFTSFTKVVCVALVLDYVVLFFFPTPVLLAPCLLRLGQTQKMIGPKCTTPDKR